MSRLYLMAVQKCKTAHSMETYTMTEQRCEELRKKFGIILSDIAQIRKQPEQWGCHNLTPGCDVSQAGVSVIVVSLIIYRDAVYLFSCESASN